jgi:hypothetical protein
MQNVKQEYREHRIPATQEFENVFTILLRRKRFRTSCDQNPASYLSDDSLVLFRRTGFYVTHEKTIITVDECMVFGPVRQSFDYTLPSKTSILVANFKDDAFYRFWQRAIESHVVQHPDDLLKENCFANLWYQLTTLQSPEEQVNFILNFCRPYLRARDQTSLLLSNFEQDHLNPVKTIAEQIQQTERNIQHKQKKQFGYSLKEINRYLRFLKAIRLIEEKVPDQPK